MEKIKICLDSACTHYRYIGEGHLIEQRKKKCDRNWKPPEGFDAQFDKMMRQVKEISLADPGTFDVTSKVGEELRLVDNRASPKNKKDRIAELQEELNELQSSNK